MIRVERCTYYGFRGDQAYATLNGVEIPYAQGDKTDEHTERERTRMSMYHLAREGRKDRRAVRVAVFDLDGTLANIDERREKSWDTVYGDTPPHADARTTKMHWDIFNDPANMREDKPNVGVIIMCKLLYASGYRIVIVSGRIANGVGWNEGTKMTTVDWLDDNGITYDELYMRSEESRYVPDHKLKQTWLDTYEHKDKIRAVYDDRDSVVRMWRENGLPTFQVAEGDF